MLTLVMTVADFSAALQHSCIAYLPNVRVRQTERQREKLERDRERKRRGRESIVYMCACEPIWRTELGVCRESSLIAFDLFYF